MPGAGSVTIGNVISESVIGTGSVTVDAGTNVVTLTAVNTYTGPTTVYSGTLQIGDVTHAGQRGVHYVRRYRQQRRNPARHWNHLSP